ncbi:hypothetical protein Patl1_06593 [Pistacia atlantica]|uniref:Uncharacterized protein n=1 Tax=Pistacia atlantica TaxID=434234 RepID=A0ACC1BUW9_9ROSI|nr:hypothetical protein Patl1_06593 [Pistacia atlantica]
MEDLLYNMFLCVIISVVIFFFIFRSSRSRRLRLPPGSLGLPFVGETLQLIAAYKTENPEPFIDERVNRFGSIFTTHVFGEPTVFSADPETNRFILQNEGKLFECSYPGSISNLLGKHSLLLMKGSLHKRMHSLTMSFANSSIIQRPSFGGHRPASPAQYGLLDRPGLPHGRSQEVKQLMSFDPGEWTESLRKEYVLVIEGFFTVPLPIFSTTYRRAIQARTKVAEALSLIVRQRRKESESVALLVAGYETTSTIMTLAVKFLTETPLALAQLKEEHEGIRKKKKKEEGLEWSDYKSMPFTQCVVNETLRLANIISGVFRRAMTDIDIKGYTIPKGWKVFASFRAVHLDHAHFKDARSFNPWRWQSNSGGTSPVNVFTPFGGGPRLCPGYELARVELSVFLHHIVTRFSWVPAEEDKLVFFPTTRNAEEQSTKQQQPYIKALIPVPVLNSQYLSLAVCSENNTDPCILSQTARAFIFEFSLLTMVIAFSALLLMPQWKNAKHPAQLL